MKSLVTRRKLVDLAKLQSEEIKFLRDQVENLRRRTFASFAIPQLPANPDERTRSNYAMGKTAAPGMGGLAMHGRSALPRAAAAAAAASSSPSMSSTTHLPNISSRGAPILPPVRGGSAGNSAR